MNPIDVIREWVGSEPSDADLLAILAANGDRPYCAALSVVRRRYADAISQPETWDIKDDYGQSMGDNIGHLSDMIGRLERMCDRESETDTQDPGSWQSVPIIGPDLSIR